ncbi:hypothetical protein TNCV_415561 [Trichonephila clavipes]|nr:hypothetical protein TNCV_415561 [Trichonephila clavipes]
MKDFKWHRSFREGKESVKDDEHSGCPQTSCTAENIEEFSAPIHEVKSASQVEVKYMVIKMESINVSMNFTSNAKSVLLLKGHISKEDVFQQLNGLSSGNGVEEKVAYGTGSSTYAPEGNSVFHDNMHSDIPVIRFSRD